MNKIKRSRVIFFVTLIAILVISLGMFGKALANLPGNEMELNFNGIPYELHADASGNLWISDYWAGEIWKVNAGGTAYSVYGVGSIPAGPGDAQLAVYGSWMTPTCAGSTRLRGRSRPGISTRPTR